MGTLLNRIKSYIRYKAGNREENLLQMEDKDFILSIKKQAKKKGKIKFI